MSNWSLVTMGKGCMAHRGEQALAYVRANGLSVATEGLVNFVLPYVIYDLAKHDLGDVKALIASSAPPLAWSLYEFARHRRIDAVSLLALGGIVLSLLAFFGGGSAKFLQLREKLVTVAIGLVFLGSAAIGRPLIYQLARAGLKRRASSELESFEALRDDRGFRRTMMIMTLAWGFGLLADAAVCGVLVFTLSISQYLIVGPIIGYATTGSLGLWTFWYARRRRRLGDARRAAEAEARRPAGSPTAVPSP